MMILKTSRSNLSSNDQLSLDLPFAATKSLAARVGPTPTFTRGSGATYIGSDGLIHGVYTSTTSNTIGTGSRTFTLAATAGQNQLWRAGDVVEASNGANLMTGTVTSYDAATQSLVCNMTSIGGSGTFTSWRIGYRGPRFDHSSAGVCRGLLIEESRTNICLQSENFGTTWTNDSGAVTITTNVEVSPDGLTTADKIAESASTTSRRISIQSISVTSGTTYSYSCYIKAGERDFAQMATGTGLNSAFQNFIVNGVNAGTLGSSSGIVSSRIDAMPNGWYRCTIVVTATATGTTQVTVGPAPSSTITRWQAYSSTAGSGIFAWGAQIEAGSFATSYIPTTTGSVVRSADVCSITGANFTSITGSVGSPFSVSVNFITDLSRLTAIAGSPLSFNTSSNNGVFLYKFNSSASFGVYHVSTNAIIGTLAAGLGKAAMAYDGDSVVGVLNNGTVSAEQGNSALAFTEMIIGSTRSGGNNFCGPISSVRVYRKRLPNAKLQALTA